MGYKRAITQTLAIDDMRTRIRESALQLKSVNFGRSEATFSWFKGQAEAGQARMISRLVDRVTAFTNSKSKASLKDCAIRNLKGMSPRQVQRLMDSLKKAGADDPVFQDFLRTYSNKGPRSTVARHAETALIAIHVLEKLASAKQNASGWTEPGLQNAALDIISVFDPWNPTLRALRLVSSGAYDVFEGGATIYFLQGELDELTSATESMLVNQKSAILTRQKLVKQLSVTRKRLDLETRLLTLRGEIWQFERNYRNLGQERDRAKIAEGRRLKGVIESKIGEYESDVTAFVAILVANEDDAIARIDQFLDLLLPESGTTPSFGSGLESQAAPQWPPRIGGSTNVILGCWNMNFMLSCERSRLERAAQVKQRDEKVKEAMEALRL